MREQTEKASGGVMFESNESLAADFGYELGEVCKQGGRVTACMSVCHLLMRSRMREADTHFDVCLLR